MKLSEVARLKAKLEIMSFMSTFYELVHAIKPRIEAIYLASKATRTAEKFKKILELILAFGNYMNASKKGPAYGFKMISLDNLSLTKSSDKKSTIVHYIVEIVNAKYPDRKGFESELRYVEKASQFSLDNITTDVKELEKGMNLTLKELDARLNTPALKNNHRTVVLKDFCENAKSQLQKLKEDSDKAKNAFIDCLEHYGEDPKGMDASTFFAILKRFCETWKNAELENIKREKLRRDKELQEIVNNNQNLPIMDQNAQNSKKNNASLIASEIKNKMNRKQINLDEVKVSYTFYPHFGMSPLKEKKMPKVNTEIKVLTDISNTRMEHLNR